MSLLLQFLPLVRNSMQILKLENKPRRTVMPLTLRHNTTAHVHVHKCICRLVFLRFYSPSWINYASALLEKLHLEIKAVGSNAGRLSRPAGVGRFHVSHL